LRSLPANEPFLILSDADAFGKPALTAG